MSAPLWFLRVNPLRRTRLSDPALRGLLADLARAEAEVVAAASAASDDLFARIGAAPEDARRDLVALRRAVHRDRDPRPGGPDVPAVAAWVAARARRAALRGAVDDGLADAAERERATLAGLLADDDLRRALALVAPEVAQEADRYRAAVAAPGPTAAKARKGERGLVQYVTRALLRTSPLSRFTAVGLAVPRPGAPGPQEVDPAGAVAVPDLERVMLGHVLAGLAPVADPADAWVGVPPTSYLDEAAGRLYLLRPTGAGLARVAVPVTPALQRLLDAVAMGPRPARSVAADLGGGPGDGAALASVLGAVRAGVLAASGAPEDVGSPIEDLLHRPGTPAAGPLARAAAALPALASAAAQQRPAVLAELGGALAEASRAAGRPARVDPEEDYVLPPRSVDPAGLAGPLDDLAATTELLSVFDWLHDVRALLSAAFVQRFGPGADVPLAAHARHLVQEVSRRAVAVEAASAAGQAPPPGTGPADGSLDRLQAVRREVTAHLHRLLDKAAGDEELVLAAGAARELADAVPGRFRADPLLYGVLVQPCGGRLVFNDGLPGHGMLFGRFLAADARLGGDARERLASRLLDRFGGDGARVVEDLGLHGLNVNAHTPVLPDGLTPDDWYRLRLVHDPATDALRVTDADGRHLRVLPLGAGHPGLFPPPLSVATGLTISGRLYSGLVGTWHAASGWDGAGTRACPRVRVGDVVLARRRWFGGAEFADAVAAGPGEGDRLRALSAWRARHGVGEEVVLKTVPPDEGPLAVGAPDVRAGRLAQKPQYVDLSSALAARVLPRMLERRAGQGTGFVEEALPAVGDGPHAAEWVVEIGRTAGGRFRYGGETS